MLANTSIVAFVPVNDLAAAEKFYAGTLGLAIVERGPFATAVATASGQTIRLVPVPGGVQPDPFTRVGWAVENIHSAAKELSANGIEPIRYPHFEQDADGIWTAPGSAAKVLWFHDQDRNVLSLSQHKAVAA